MDSARTANCPVREDIERIRTVQRAQTWYLVVGAGPSCGPIGEFGAGDGSGVPSVGASMLFYVTGPGIPDVDEQLFSPVERCKASAVLT